MVIGTASIVVMISLGLGMQQSMYKQIEQAGGMTAITVTGQDVGGMMYYMSYAPEEGEATKYVTDDTIAEIEKLEHVKSVTPSLTKPFASSGISPIISMSPISISMGAVT